MAGSLDPRVSDSPLLTRRALLTRSLADSAAPADCWIRVHRRIMACRFEILLPGEDGRHVAAARAALDTADRLEDLMTVFRAHSELVRLNRCAHHEPTHADPLLFDVLQLCAAVSRDTDGAFDITSTPLSRCWGFLRREGRLPAGDDIEAARRVVSMDHVQLDAAAGTVGFRREGVELNLGSIGKGVALDRMGADLRAAGVADALLSAGRSSILAISRTARRWPIDLVSTVRGDVLARLHVRNGAVGTSGSGEQFVEVDGLRYGHVMDPRTGWPATGVLSSSVVTSSAALADALSTAFLIGGVDLARRYCARHDGVLALVTPDDGSGRPVLIGKYVAATLEQA